MLYQGSAQSSLRVAGAAKRHVRVAAQRAFLHVAVANSEVAHERVDLAHVGRGLGGRAHVRLGHDLQQRRAGAVEIDPGQLAEALVHRLAGVLLEVGARDPDPPFLTRTVQLDVHVSPAHYGELVLADLVALGKIRIEVVLAGEYRTRCNRGIDGQSELRGHPHDFGVKDRQHARIAEVDQAGLGIRLGSISR